MVEFPVCVGPAADRPDGAGDVELAPRHNEATSAPVEVEGGRNYLMSGWCRAVDTIGASVARFVQLDADGRAVAQSQFIQWFRPREWVRAERVVTVDPRSERVRVALRGTSEGGAPSQRAGFAGLTLTPTDRRTVEQTLDDYLSSPAPAPRAHPWMVYTPEELPELRGRAARGPGSIIWQHLIEQCEKHYDEERPINPPRPVPYPQPGFNEAYYPQTGHYGDCIRATQLSHMYNLAAVVTGRRRYIDKALQWLLRPVDWPAWCVCENGRWEVEVWDLCVGKKLGEMGLGYDMLHDYLSEGQRGRLIEKLAFYADLLMDSYYRPLMCYGRGWLVSRHTPVNIACLGLCGLALLGDHPDAGKWLQFARFFFKEHALDGGDHLFSDGGYDPGYYWYGCWINRTCAFLHCLRRLDGEDLFSLPAMRNTVFYTLYGWIPPDRLLVFGTTHYSTDYYHLRHPMAALARYQDSAEAWSFVAGDAPSVEGPDGGQYPDLGAESESGGVVHGGPGWMFHWAGRPPGPLGQLPKARVFPQTGLAVLRSGWGRDDVVLGLKCGGRRNRNRDNNQIVLEGFGGTLILGHSLREGDTRDTNSYLVDGQGQERHTATCIGWTGTPAGRIAGSFFSETADYVLGDARYSYFVDGRNLRAAERHVVYLRPDAFVLRDRLAVAEGRPARFDLLLHPGAACEHLGRSLRIEHEGGQAVVTYLAPSAVRVDYGRPDEWKYCIGLAVGNSQGSVTVEREGERRCLNVTRTNDQGRIVVFAGICPLSPADHPRHMTLRFRCSVDGTARLKAAVLYGQERLLGADSSGEGSPGPIAAQPQWHEHVSQFDVPAGKGISSVQFSVEASMHPGQTAARDEDVLGTVRVSDVALAGEDGGGEVLPLPDTLRPTGFGYQSHFPPYVIHPEENRDEADFVWMIATAPSGVSARPCELVETESAIGARVGDDLVLWPKCAGRCRAEAVEFDAELAVVRADGSWVVVSGRYLRCGAAEKVNSSERVSQAGR